MSTCACVGGLSSVYRSLLVIARANKTSQRRVTQTHSQTDTSRQHPLRDLQVVPGVSVERVGEVFIL